MANMNFAKLPADRHVTPWMGPSGGTTLGITDIEEPLAAELNNTGGTSGILNIDVALSWNDFDFGTQASETLNEPSFADAASYVEFGQANYGGTMSTFLPEDFNDLSDPLANVFQLTQDKYHFVDVALRIDGDVKTSEPAADGDFVSTYRVQSGADQNPFTPGESKRRTVNYVPKSDFSHYTVVGSHAITIIAPTTFTVGDKGRIRASQGGRDRTNALRAVSSNPAVITIKDGGAFEVIGAGSANITFTDRGTGDTAVEAVTVP